MKRHIAIPLAAFGLAALLVLGLAGCGTQNVKVETGERIVCAYGEVLTDTVRAIEVPVDKAGTYSVKSKTVVCDLHKRLETLYTDAQTAIATGDFATAKAKLEEIVAQDSGFKEAQAQLDAISAGKKPTPDPNTGTPSSPGSPGGSGGSGGGGGSEPEPEPIGPVASLRPWVPDALSGYKASPILSDPFSLTRQYVPLSDAAPCDSLVIVVQQYGSTASAQKVVAGSVARSYSANASQTSIEGRSVRFGTDGRRFGAVAWSEGALVIVIEGSSRSRMPDTLKSHLLDLAGEVIK